VHASTWASGGLGVALSGFGRRGGLGSLVVSLVGARGACGGPGERRGDGVPVQSAYAKTASKKPHQATKSKAQADFCGFRSTRAAVETKSNRATRRYDGTEIGSQITTQCNSESRRIAPDNSNRLRFLRVTTCVNASQPTCPDRALDRSVRRDRKVT
jgi:hypothetical protein